MNPKDYETFHIWGSALSNLAKLNKDEKLHRQAIEKYETAAALNPKDEDHLDFLALTLTELAALNGDVSLFEQAIEKHKEAIELGASTYNLACTYALMKEKDRALEYLENNIVNNEISLEHVEKDEDWEAYRTDPDFIALLDRYRQ